MWLSDIKSDSTRINNLEDVAVGAYKKVETAFVEAFLEEAKDEDSDQVSDAKADEDGAYAESEVDTGEKKEAE